ncbi:MFS transporter [Paenibacillus sp. ACRRX]|uniref:MFS transporter n=1 Tax=Paenibacillus sp. ACRRX TaxID=2918206 RepID=UPI001EF5BB3F|nr:MFS transporter [Paenibacillus sp. ACRRX]MCG7408148.1 MFS transporter [Paenibacillus sp. ACRRX]
MAQSPSFTASPSGSSLPVPAPASKTVYRILIAISFVHLFNDSIQAVITAIFPVLRDSMSLTYVQIGWISFALNVTASIMQPVVGYFSDRRPTPSLLPIGMCFTFTGMLLLAYAPNYLMVLVAVIFVGLGSAAFHPEGMRVAHMAAGSRKGLAQSIFQVGGNTGQSLAPLMTKWIFIPLGQVGAIWFTVVAAAGIIVQSFIARWYSSSMKQGYTFAKKLPRGTIDPAQRKRIMGATVILVTIVTIRSWYVSAISTYYNFYLQSDYGLSKGDAQTYIFIFMAAGAVGTLLGGPLADRFGKRNLISASLIGAIPLALILPYLPLFWAGVVLALSGFILLSSFATAVIYAQALYPSSIGTVSGLITGLAFGMGGIGSLLIGFGNEWTSESTMMIATSFLPLLGLLTLFLPSDHTVQSWTDGHLAAQIK